MKKNEIMTGILPIVALAGLGYLIWSSAKGGGGGGGGTPAHKFNVGDVCVSNIDPEYIVKITGFRGANYTADVLTKPYWSKIESPIATFDVNFHLQGTPAPAPGPTPTPQPKFSVGDICEATISGVYYGVQITGIDLTDALFTGGAYLVTSYPETWQGTEYGITWFDAVFRKVG